MGNLVKRENNRDADDIVLNTEIMKPFRNMGGYYAGSLIYRFILHIGILKRY